MAHAILSRGKKSRPERRGLLALARMFRVERRCPHRLPSRSFASFASFARTTRPSLPPRLRSGSVGLGTKTAPVPGGCGSRALKTLFSPVLAGLERGSQGRFPTVPNGSRAGSVRSQVRGPSTKLKSQRSAEHCSAASLTLHASSPARGWKGHQPDAVYCSNFDSCILFINTTFLLPASGKACMYLYVIIHNNKNATVAGCSALEIGANHPGSNRPVLLLKKGTHAQHGY